MPKQGLETRGNKMFCIHSCIWDGTKKGVCDGRATDSVPWKLHTLELSPFPPSSALSIFPQPCVWFCPSSCGPSLLFCKIQCYNEDKKPCNSRPSKCCSDHWSYLLENLGTGAGYFFQEPRNNSLCAFRNIEATMSLWI